MQFIKSDVNINFIGKRKIAFFVSIAMIVISIISLILHGGPKQGIDFAGGTLIQVKFLAPIKIDDINAGLQSIGLGKSSVQSFGEQESNEYLIRTDSSVMAAEGFSLDVEKALASSTGRRCGNPAYGNGRRPGRTRLEGKSFICHVLCPVVYHHLYFGTL